MIYGLYESAAGMLTHEYRQSVIANNLANADTAGFKQDSTSFAERLTASEAGGRSGPSNPLYDDLGGGVWVGRARTNFSPGPLAPSELPTDVALDGPGFFAVQGAGGPLYTRDGRFLMAPDGSLVAAVDNAPVLGPAGQPLRLNPRRGQPMFANDGTVMQDGVRVGQLGIADFADYAALRKVGTNRFDARGQAPVASPAEVRGGYYEQSTVEPVQELVKMIEAARAYQLNAQMVSMQDQSVGRLISTIAA